MALTPKKISTLTPASTPAAADVVPGVQGGDNVKFTISQLQTLVSYTVATLPATAPAGALIFVTDESGGAVPAFGDGTNWRRVTDRAIVS